LTYLTRGVDSTTIVAAGRAHTPSGHTRVATCGTVRGPGDCGRAGLNSLKHYGTRSLVAVVGATPPYTSDVRRAPGCGSRLVSGALLYSSRLVPSYLFTGAAQGSPRSLSVRPAWWPCWCSAAGQRHGPGRRHVRGMSVRAPRALEPTFSTTWLQHVTTTEGVHRVGLHRQGRSRLPPDSCPPWRPQRSPPQSRSLQLLCGERATRSEESRERQLRALALEAMAATVVAALTLPTKFWQR
jgi:hypothetical protein